MSTFQDDPDGSVAQRGQGRFRVLSSAYRHIAVPESGHKRGTNTRVVVYDEKRALHSNSDLQVSGRPQARS